MAAQILIVTDDATLQALLRDSVTGAGYEALLATSGVDGLRRWKVEDPSLLVIDANLSGLDGVALTERIRGMEPAGTRVAIIVLGGADQGVKLRSLQAGADDHLGVPVHSVELMARVRRLLARSLSRNDAATSPADGPAMGQVLAFYGAKGGVGTTTIAINVAIGLHRQHRRNVALVDANLQFGDHRVFLDVGVDRRSLMDIVAANSIDLELLESIMVRHASGIELLLAPPSPEVADLVSAEHHHVLQVTELLRTQYDYVIVDLDQRLDDHGLDVLGVADQVLVVMTADLSCIKNVRLLMETMRQVGVPSDRFALVMNRSNAMTGVSTKSVEAVLKQPIEHMVVNDYRAAITALNTGRPFQMGKPEGGISESIADMVRRIDGAHHEHPASNTVIPPRLRALTAGASR